jgi:hypothetical protein
MGTFTAKGLRELVGGVAVRRDTFSTTAGGGGDPIDAWPVGSIFIGVSSTNPATLLGGGTWVSFGAGRVLVGLDAGDPSFDTVKETGGAKTVAAAGTNSAPAFTGSALGTHQHGVGSLAASAHSGAAVSDHSNHTHPYNGVINHTHAINISDSGHNHTQNPHNHSQLAHSHSIFRERQSTTGTDTTHIARSTDTSSTKDTAPITEAYTAQNVEATASNISNTTGITASSNNPSGGVASADTGTNSIALSHSVTQPSAHTMSGSSEAVSAGTPAGTVAAPVFTGSATSVIQPYIVVYMWERTA